MKIIDAQIHLWTKVDAVVVFGVRRGNLDEAAFASLPEVLALARYPNVAFVISRRPVRTSALTVRDSMMMLAFWLQIGTSPMPSITIKSISPTLHERLKDIARRHHRSLQNEIVACLERHAERPPRSKAELMADAAALRDKLPFFDHALVDRYKRSGRP